MIKKDKRSLIVIATKATQQQISDGEKCQLVEQDGGYIVLLQLSSVCHSVIRRMKTNFLSHIQSGPQPHFVVEQINVQRI